MIEELKPDGAYGDIVAKNAIAYHSPRIELPTMPSRKKINFEKVLGSLNTICPKCQSVIEPAQIRRVSFDEIKCPWYERSLDGENLAQPKTLRCRQFAYTWRILALSHMSPVNAVRPWRIVAEEITHEQNTEKLTRLADELNQALDEQELHGREILKQPAGKPNNEKTVSAA